MSGSTSETKLINFAMANKTRRKIINFLANGDRDIEEIEGIIGEKTLTSILRFCMMQDLLS